MAIAVIPARYASSRFPGKPLALLNGRPMVEHVWRRCTEARCFAQVLVATDDSRIADAVAKFGGTVVITSPDCRSGTERVAEVAQGCDGQLFVNVQGDEPAIHPSSLVALTALISRPEVQMATLVRPLEDAELGNPNLVKVVRDEQGAALYFSRHDLPFVRGPQAGLQRWAHLGSYAWKRQTLIRLAALPPTSLELAERLEQLRALGNGIAIHCAETSHRSQAVDVAEDLPLAEAALKEFDNR